jgi:hypothetical protein
MSVPHRKTTVAGSRTRLMAETFGVDPLSMLASATKTLAVSILPRFDGHACASNVTALLSMTTRKKATRIPLDGPSWQPLEMAAGNK